MKRNHHPSPHSGAVTFTGARGRARVENHEGVIRFHVSGHYCGELSAQVIALMSAWTDALGTIRFFVDFGDMSGYDTVSRAAGTAWCKSRLPQLDAMHILSRPGIVAMGVTAAAMTLLILGLDVEAHGKRATFERAFEESLRGDWRYRDRSVAS